MKGTVFISFMTCHKKPDIFDLPFLCIKRHFVLSVVALNLKFRKEKSVMDILKRYDHVRNKDCPRLACLVSHFG